METIPFTQYLRPDGRGSKVEAPTPEGWGDKVQAFLDGGIVFSCEILTTGQVVLYAGINGEDFATEITSNGPEIDDALVRLLERTIEHLKAKP